MSCFFLFVFLKFAFIDALHYEKGPWLLFWSRGEVDGAVLPKHSSFRELYVVSLLLVTFNFSFQKMSLRISPFGQRPWWSSSWPASCDGGTQAVCRVARLLAHGHSCFGAPFCGRRQAVGDSVGAVCGGWFEFHQGPRVLGSRRVDCASSFSSLFCFWFSLSCSRRTACGVHCAPDESVALLGRHAIGILEESVWLLSLPAQAESCSARQLVSLPGCHGMEFAIPVPGDCARPSTVSLPTQSWSRYLPCHGQVERSVSSSSDNLKIFILMFSIEGERRRRSAYCAAESIFTIVRLQRHHLWTSSQTSSIHRQSSPKLWQGCRHQVTGTLWHQRPDGATDTVLARHAVPDSAVPFFEFLVSRSTVVDRFDRTKEWKPHRKVDAGPLTKLRVVCCADALLWIRWLSRMPKNLHRPAGICESLTARLQHVDTILELLPNFEHSSRFSPKAMVVLRDPVTGTLWHQRPVGATTAAVSQCLALDSAVPLHALLYIIWSSNGE